MTDTKTIDWQGRSGKSYAYWIYPISQNFQDKPGNYIFAREPSPGNWTPVYIGQTQSLAERFDNHHAMPCIKRNGATHIHAHVNDGGEQTRRVEERDLIDNYDPVCNKT